jgi:hypothetical protein
MKAPQLPQRCAQHEVTCFVQLTGGLREHVVRTFHRGLQVRPAFLGHQQRIAGVGAAINDCACLGREIACAFDRDGAGGRRFVDFESGQGVAESRALTVGRDVSGFRELAQDILADLGHDVRMRIDDFGDVVLN